MKILVTYAVKEEFVELPWKNVEVYYLRTGIGKVKSASYLTDIINQVQPDLVLNIGTCGTLNHEIGQTFICSHFIDRDLIKLASYGLEYEIDVKPLLDASTVSLDWNLESCCSTGDTFVTETSDEVFDVVDMEGYAQAFVCRSKKVPFLSIKYITDVIGQNSLKHWEDKLLDAKAGLTSFISQLSEPTLQ